ncbi:MAG: effector binding domain-containing protein [Candidatus Delongbacteria bacterium]|nr:effector binding domain-containing protein [Candidatus Delongbacteria bacterium]MBN2834164.1 effector binding domain-containing protein [Candidatus Delongbacteria bacterium]
MELKTIREVTLDYGVSRRMLSYYEEIGLIESCRKDGYAYRVYDEDAIQRIQQIIILRKLQIPVKQIIDILNNQNAVELIEIFKQNMNDLDEEITALSTLKSILSQFVTELEKKANVNLKIELLNDKTMLAIASTLSFSKNKIKENLSMDELNKANEKLSKLEDKDVRIVYLPPMTIAAAYASGEGCEGKTIDMILKYINDSDLLKVKPDARSFGFDCSNGSAAVGEPSHVYETWVSIPDDMEVPAPLIKRTFKGGLYAAHVLRSWDFQDWRLLSEWVNASGKYVNDWNSPRWESKETMAGQGFEETLNFFNFVRKGGKMEDLQLDLLFPIIEKV